MATIATTMAVPIRYEHTGHLDWECGTCKKTGFVSFIIETETEVPLVADYDHLLTDAEVDHAAGGCKGRPVMIMAKRSKVVEHLGKVRRNGRL